MKLRELIPSKRKADARARTLTLQSNALANAIKDGNHELAREIRRQMGMDK